MVIYGNAGLIYSAAWILYIFGRLWAPYWEVFAMLSAVAAAQGRWLEWVATGGNAHTLTALIGGQVPLLGAVTIGSLLMIAPLVKHLSIAARGVTVLESTASTLDCIQLPNGKVMMVRGFSRGSMLRNLRALLGPRWRCRLFCPVRGSADSNEEVSPALSPGLAKHLKERFGKSSSQSSDPPCGDADDSNTL
eukprot:gnl/TRDRNA2_/TRDRNA2_104701_c0_seq1.p1 gnl/TRDRNA2_/TRDRNA2_104701_c0~~gnl/TRDRNA2_/TRDRNA2_104701_c0_seq1.p1  ORF type:complete len:211 (+),score=19.50 gnl/TRDRNA2_/TRDRNA2_104701_c0_seq1:59-634(+)